MMSRTVPDDTQLHMNQALELPPSLTVVVVQPTTTTPTTPNSDEFYCKHIPINAASLHEITVLTALSSQYVVRLDHIIQSETSYTLVLVHEGKDLSRLLQSGAPFDNAPAMFCRVLSAVSYLHNAGYCHLDLKPSNIIVCQRLGTCRIADFGHACQNSEMLSGAKGSPGFFAPEMFTEAQYDGGKADVWSLGVVFMEMILGSDVFEQKWMSVGPFANIEHTTTKDVFHIRILRALKSLRDLERNDVYSQAIGLVFRHTVCYQPRRRWCVQEVEKMVRDMCVDSSGIGAVEKTNE